MIASAISPTENLSKVQLFILSRDRTSFCRETVTSALAQTYPFVEVIVSDNSENGDVAEMLACEFPNVRMIRRQPTLPALSHFNQLIDEAEAELLVLFHDDDILEPEYVTRMVAHLHAQPEAVAVGCNAYIIRGQQQSKKPFMGSFRGKAILQQPAELLEPYLSLSLISPAPFPGYMYRTASIKGLGLDAEHGGKHADVSFLTKLLDRGPLLWCEDCLFNYRFHSSNDSSRESIGDRLSWLRYIHKTNGINVRSRAVLDYKLMYWFRWLQQNESSRAMWGQLSNRRSRTARRFVRNWLLRMVFTRADFWRRAWRAVQR